MQLQAEAGHGAATPGAEKGLGRALSSSCHLWEHSLADTWSLDFWSPELWQNQVLMSSHPDQGHLLH